MRRTRLALAASLFAGFALPLLGSSAAQADPQSDVADAQKKLAALQDQAERTTEQWHKAQIVLTGAKAAEASAQAALTRSQAAVSTERARVVAAASAEYKAGALGQVATFIGSSDPQTFLDSAADLGQLAHGRSEEISQLASIVKQQNDAQAVLDQATKTADSAAKTADSQKAAVDASVSQQQSILADAIAKQAEVVRQQQEAAARADAAHKAAALLAAQQAQALATSLAAQQAGTTVAVDADPAPSAPIRTGNGVAAVLAEAQRQLGKPYVYGAAGPGSFDCSGLTMWAYRAAGVSLPHYTGAQWGYGRHVSRSELQPGDLVFFGSDIHHVGIYVGGGNMLDAPHSGAVVRVEPLFADYAGAVRIFG